MPTGSEYDDNDKKGGLRGIRYFAEGHTTAETKGSGLIYTYMWLLKKDGSVTDRVGLRSGVGANGTGALDACDWTKGLGFTQTPNDFI